MNVSSARGVVASGTSRMLDVCTAYACIMIAYGHATACRVLHGCRAAQLLAGGGAARRHAACRQPPDPFAREASWPPAARPLGASGRADRGRPAPVPERTAAAR